ncbi:MAG: glycosyl hydrolase family 79 C-terminal domain-containing protein [Limisphaerales bacterium]
MKSWSNVLFVTVLSAIALHGQVPISVTVDTQKRGYAIDPHFCGVSIFTRGQVRDHRGMKGFLFSKENKALVTLFRNAGIRHVRLGATGSARSETANLTHDEIDALFAFAKATDVKVIFSLHAADAGETAKYVWDHYRPWLDYFAFDNEPDGRSQQFFDDWRIVVRNVTNAVPDAKFAGPDAAGRTLALKFIDKVKDTSRLELVTQHTYIGGNSRKKNIDVPHGVDLMLSKEWPKASYPALYQQVCHPVLKEGLGYRLTELDDFVHGVTNASDSYSAALWALDCMHWWAKHGATGVNFQNSQWLPTDTFYIDAKRQYQMHPKAYGLRAFEVGSHGWTESVAMDNPRGLNVMAYAVGDETNCCVTIINKEHGANAGKTTVTIAANGFEAKRAGVMVLKAANVNVMAMKDVTLGGSNISNDKEWRGKWREVRISDGKCLVDVEPASAVILRLGAK